MDMGDGGGGRKIKGSRKREGRKPDPKGAAKHEKIKKGQSHAGDKNGVLKLGLKGTANRKFKSPIPPSPPSTHTV